MATEVNGRVWGPSLDSRGDGRHWPGGQEMSVGSVEGRARVPGTSRRQGPHGRGWPPRGHVRVLTGWHKSSHASETEAICVPGLRAPPHSRRLRIGGTGREPGDLHVFHHFERAVKWTHSVPS